jgi:hypothetical protein
MPVLQPVLDGCRDTQVAPPDSLFTGALHPADWIAHLQGRAWKRQGLHGQKKRLVDEGGVPDQLTSGRDMPFIWTIAACSADAGLFWLEHHSQGR